MDDYRRKLWAFCVPEVVFDIDNNYSLKSEFEGIFLSIGETPVNVEFQYFRSFDRILIIYDNEELASIALDHLKGIEFHGTPIILEPVKPLTIGDGSLCVPEKTNNFMISPPPSPPMGWEPSAEAPPTLIDYNLIAAMSRLRVPGEAQEVYIGNDIIPSIVVSCEDHNDNIYHPSAQDIASCRTPRPP